MPSKIVQRASSIVVLMVSMIVCSVLPSAYADDSPENLLLSSTDLPPGFTALAEREWIRPDDRLAQFSCQDQQGTKQLAGVVAAGRAWGGDLIVEDLVGRVVSEYAAGSLQRDIRSCFRAYRSFLVDGVPDADGRAFDTTVEDVPVSVHLINFRRGEFVFVITTIEARPGTPDLAVRLAAAQAARAPAGSSAPAPPPPARNPASVVGYTFGTLLIFFLLWPEIKDALSSRLEHSNRHRRRPPAAPDVPPEQVVDVVEAASWLHLRAVGLFLLELIVLVGSIPVVLGAIRSGSPGETAVLLGVAVAAMVGLGWLRRKSLGSGLIVRRRRTVLSVIVTCVAALTSAVGIGLLVLGVIPPDIGQNEYTGEASQSNVLRYVALLVLIVGVAIQRIAVRLTMSRPAASVLRDRRPPILYLRSFADDMLKVYVAPVARVSLLERFSSRRKQGFEEVLAEELQRHGPVVAIGEPGRRLPPIGFVRQSLDGAEWQVGVRERMLECGMVVVVVGRGHGLIWELKTLFELSQWKKVLLVFPPVDSGFNARWAEVVELLADNGVHEVGFPAESSLLGIALTDEKKCLYFCGKNKSAWSYKAAIDAAVRQINPAAQLHSI